MAVLKDEKAQNQNEDRVIIDPFAQGVEEGNSYEQDLDADAYEVVKPIPAGRYDVLVTEAKECWEQKKTKEGEIFYNGNLQLTVTGTDDPEKDGAVTFAKVSTYLGRGKKISTMAYVMLKLGYPKDKLVGEISPLMLCKKFAQFLRKQDRVAKAVMLDWQGWSKIQEAVVYSKMSDFPTGPGGVVEHIVNYKKTGFPSEEIIAKLKLKDWGASATSAPSVGKAAAPAAAKPTIVKKAVAAPTTAPEPDEDELEGAAVVKPTAAPAAPAKAKAKAKPPVEADESDVDGLLADDGDL